MQDGRDPTAPEWIVYRPTAVATVAVRLASVCVMLGTVAQDAK